MAGASSAKVRDLTWLALFLALVGGFVDAVGYLVLFNLFTAHMSGNSVAMSVHLGELNWGTAFFRGFPIPLFVVGVVAGAVLSEALFRRGMHALFAPTLGLEAMFLIVFMLCGGAVLHNGAVRPEGGWTFYLIAALLPLAMGIQNSALHRISGTGVRTTFITGMLTNGGLEFANYMYWLGDHVRRRKLGVLLVLSPRQQQFRKLILYFAIWTGYVSGDVVGTLTELRWGLVCLAAPAAALIGVAVRDLIRPLAPPNKPPRTKPEWKV